MQDMELKASAVTNFLKGLANSHRIKILCLLANGEKSVGALIEATNIAQTTMSQHLLKLRGEGIVDYRRDHRTLYYSIVNDAALDIMAVLHNHFCSASPPLTKNQMKEK